MGITTCCNADEQSKTTMFEITKQYNIPKVIDQILPKENPADCYDPEKDWGLDDNFKIPFEILSNTERGLRLVHFPILKQGKRDIINIVNFFIEDSENYQIILNNPDNKVWFKKVLIMFILGF